MNASVSPTRSRSSWPLALGLSGQPTPWMTPEHMQLARELTDGTKAMQDSRETVRGSLGQRLLETFLQGLTTAGQAHAAARGLMLQ